MGLFRYCQARITRFAELHYIVSTKQAGEELFLVLTKAATVRVALAWALLAGGNNLLMQFCLAAEPPRARILPKDVTLTNVAAFEKRFSADLPLGTSKDAVEAYLLRWDLPHRFEGKNSPADQNTFFTGIENIGLRLSFAASLVIKVRLNEMDKVEKIEYRIDYLAP